VSEKRPGVVAEPDAAAAPDEQRPDSAGPKRWFNPYWVTVAIGAVMAVAVAVVVVAIQSSGTGTGNDTGRTPQSIPGAPSGSTVLFSDTFSDGKWCDYNRVQNRHYSDPACGYHNKSYSLRVVDGAARFEVRPGDSPGGGLKGGERSEISQDSASWQAKEGDEWYVHERLRLDSHFTPGRWTILTQFHAGSGPPPLSLQMTREGALVLRSSGKAGDVNKAAGGRDRVLVPADAFMGMRGHWFDVDLHVRWSNRRHVGGTEAYINGKRVAPWQEWRTMASSRIYWKAGIYRTPTDSTQVLWLDDLVISAPGRGRG